MTATTPSRAGARGGLWCLALLLALALHAAGGAWLTQWHPAPTTATVSAPVMAQLIIKPSKPAAPPSAPPAEIKKPPAKPVLAARPRPASQPRPVPAPRSEAVPLAVAPPPPAAPTAPVAPASVSTAAPSPAPAVAPPVPDLAAHCLYRQAPVYPAAARRRRLEGSVRLQVALDATGAIDAVTLIESSGSPLLDAAALAAVRRWRCEPARVDGQPVPTVAVQRINFQLR
ncbi:MAG: energy transducer TonB [Gammaproteobacteria bacterium]|nr:energy transducer TonB [Gammaproteobacteria bacterium]